MKQSHHNQHLLWITVEGPGMQLSGNDLNTFAIS